MATSGRHSRSFPSSQPSLRSSQFEALINPWILLNEHMLRYILLTLLTIIAIRAEANDQAVISLWPDQVPGQSEPKAPPVYAPTRGDGITRIKKVTDPALVVYEAAPEKHNGAAVIICPGGGYSILAIDHEGTKVAEWLSELGYTAFVLQYRVPKNRSGALQDAQRAIRYVRGNRQKWKLDENKIGVIGFSAGGSLCARLSTRYAEELYPRQDELDAVSARPDFAVLIYPAYLDEGEGKTLTPELKITKETPPMFLFVAEDDGFADSSRVMTAALQAKGIPAEMYLYPRGGHGFGMKEGNAAAAVWPPLCAQWLAKTISSVSSK